jgi:hypothetical protein
MIHSIEQGRKEDGNRSIADKIIKRLHDLELTVESNFGRWAWELLQNAKDSVAESNRDVSIEIELNQNNVIFRHNGTHFTEQDVRGLINQISSKEVNKGSVSTKTGKFGTGFLTTHLLSRTIQVKGVIETNSGDLYRFSFLLDRNGTTTAELIPKIEKAWSEFHRSTEGNIISDLTSYNEEEFNTSFTYDLSTPEQHETAETGIQEFLQLIPFVLAFIPKIKAVSIYDHINGVSTKFENTQELRDEILLDITKHDVINNIETKIHLLFVEENDVAIASIVEEKQDGLFFKSIQDLPKLFCDFPLIGTEDFYFPVIVNSFYFNPLTERDGIWLKGDGKKEVEENRAILKKAVDLYELLLGKISESNFFNCYNICTTKTPDTNEKYFDENWYEENIQVRLRKSIRTHKVIELRDGTKFPFEATDSWIDIPSADKKEDRETIWELCNVKSYFILPKREHVHHWYELNWDEKFECTVEFIFSFIKEQGTIEVLQESLGDRDVWGWLNKVFEFAIEQQHGYKLFDNYAVIPNQEGTLRTRKQLSLDEIEDEKLKEIAALLGYNYYEDLIDKRIFFEERHDKISKQDAALKITELISDIEKNALDIDEVTAIRLLTEWFDYNKDEGKALFPELYRRKEKLFVDTIDEEDKEHLYGVLKTNTPLSKLADIANAIEKDPEVLVLIQDLIREKRELSELKEVGEYFEIVLEEALKEFGFEVKNVVVGKDLIITLQKSQTKFFIEVKSTKQLEFVAMTSAQGKEAVANFKNYALCVIYNNGTKPNVDYIKRNAKLRLDIGELLRPKVSKVVDFENKQLEISTTTDEIVLSFDKGLEYKYQISNKIWGKGKTFAEFVNYLIKSDQKKLPIKSGI